VSGAARAARLALGAAAVALLVRGAWALATSVARDVAMDSPLRVALVPVLLVGLGAGLASRARPTRAARWVPLVATTAGALAGLAWAGATATEAAVAGALFVVAAALATAGGRAPDLPVARRRTAPPYAPPYASRDASRDEEEPPRLG